MTLTFLMDVHIFTRWLFIPVFTVVSFKVVLNVLCIALKWHHLFDFFKKSASYETSYSGIQGIVLKVSCVAGNFIFYVYQMVDFVVLRPCLEVLLLYIRQQYEVVRCMIDGGGSTVFVNPARKVEEVRMNLCAIALLKQQLNCIWRWSIMASGAVVLLFACSFTYSAFVEGFSTLQSLVGMIYTSLLVLDLLDIAGLSQEMVNEISYLRDTIKPKEMAISGAGFFSLNLPLIVSLAGSVITYTVILVQTSESVNTAAK
ncbi:hypothetical protein HPB49_022340 [Dermacentor silvarum]|uniref:Uncharacterized protein n=1 Tax=Dermacentor silvarum TaxID=543639 RepID=A0ACB8CT44_DERSI|nr:hypothetical protein HPB49_022340 [Dermacentor silvarum]